MTGIQRGRGVRRAGSTALRKRIARIAAPGAIVALYAVNGAAQIVPRERVSEAVGLPTYDPARRNIANPPALPAATGPRHTPVFARDVFDATPDPSTMTFYLPASTHGPSGAMSIGADAAVRAVEMPVPASSMGRSPASLPLYWLVPRAPQPGGPVHGAATSSAAESESVSTPEARFGERLRQRVREPSAPARSNAHDAD